MSYILKNRQTGFLKVLNHVKGHTAMSESFHFCTFYATFAIFFLIIAILVSVVLIFVFFMTKDIEYLSMCLLAIFIVLEQCQLRSFAFISWVICLFNY